MHKKLLQTLLASALTVALLAGCGSDAGSEQVSGDAAAENTAEQDTDVLENGNVELTIRAESTSFDTVQSMLDSFQEKYKGQATFTFNLIEQDDASTKDDVLADVHAAGDIFSFPDDQFDALMASGILAPMESQEMIKSSYKEDAVAAVTYKDTVYAIPYTADNGYFLYYDKRVLSEEDVKSFDSLLAACNAIEKKVSMDLTSGWYLYSFFGQTGLDFGINDDGVTNHCSWNDTSGPIKGTDVGNAIAAIASDPAFVAQGDDGFLKGVADGTVAAGISGTWNAVDIKKAWGENYGATKLPTYTCAGKQIQMSSFKGFKNMGVSEYSPHKGWAMKLCEWLTNEENQTLRLQQLNQGPAHIAASQSDAVMKVPAIRAVMEQSEFASLQRVGGKYWGACTTFAETLAAGNPAETPMQELMDKLAEGISASTAE